MRHHRYKDRYKNYEFNRQRGYGVQLYRNKRDGEIAGVCAGLGDHLEVSHWVVRLAFIGAAFMSGGTFIWVYVIAWCLLAPQPEQYSEDESAFYYDEKEHRYRKNNIFRYRDSASVRIRRARSRLNDALDKVENMERYVTSKRYKLDKEFSKL